MSISGLDPPRLTPPLLVAPLYTSAVFTCEGTGDQLNWIVQSTILTDSIKQKRNITVSYSNSSSRANLSLVLSVNALPLNDGLNIGCQLVLLSPFDQIFSSTSTLIIEG